MKYLLIGIILLGSNLLSYSQKKIASFEPNSKKPKIKHLLANCNNEGVIGVSYVLNKKFCFSAIGNDGKILIQQECVNRSKYKLEPQGAIVNKNQFVHFFQSPQSRQTYGIISVLDRKITRPFRVPLPTPGEVIIGGIFEADTYYRIGINKAQKKLVVSKFLIDGLKFKSTYFDLPEETIKAIAKLFRPINTPSENNVVSVIETDNLTNPSLARNSFKLYHLSENKIALTIDGGYSTKPNNTELLTFNWETGEKEQYYFGQSTTLKDKSIANSIIYQKNLYHLSITVDYLYLAIYELTNKELVKSYHYKSTDREISLMKSNLLINTHGYKFVDEYNTSIPKNQSAKVLRKLKNGIPFIFPKTYGEEDNFVLVVGSGIESTINAVTPSFFPGGGGSSSVNYDASQYFITELNDNFQISETILPTKAHAERRRDYFEKVLTPWHKKTSFKNPQTGNLIFAQYWREDNLIKIVEL